MRPFLLVDWRADFIDALKDIVLAETGGDMQGALVLFPHQRPQRHLMARLTHDPELPKPLFLPHMHSVTEWLPGLRRDLDPTPLVSAGILDRVGLLYEVVDALRGEEEGLLAHLPMERDRFFPWGRRLADLFEELMRHSLTPRDFGDMQGEVAHIPAALLERLGRIFNDYSQALAARGWSTAGQDSMLAASLADRIAEQYADTPIFIAGFYALTGTEETVFRALWEQGNTRIIQHTDLSHWACREHVDWMRRWNATGDSVPVEHADSPSMHFYEGFDLHSQLESMRQGLEEVDRTDTAVVIPDTSCLMPVLHHLPEKDVNISMGYPLARSGLFRLMDTILRLQESSPEPGRYYWRDLVELIRHPYIKMLSPKPELPIRPLLREMERTLRTGGRFFEPLSWAPSDAIGEDLLAQDIDINAALEALRGVLKACLTGFENPGSLAELADSVLDLARTLAPEHTAETWHRFPVDAECLYRLAGTVAQQLAESYISHDRYDKSVLFSILRQLMETERVPFEAEPLSGLQVMGMLESRLLHFKRVLVLDAVEDKLPGSATYDPLLPDPLRVLLNLPDGRHRSLVAAYNFHRLISGASEAWIFYQSGSEGAGPIGGKNIRSRFVEQLLWEEERKAGKVVKPDGDLLTALTLPVQGIPRTQGVIEKNDAIQTKLLAMLTGKKISATFLDSYLHCPMRFFLDRLTVLREPDEVSEDGDPLELGKLVHKVLQDFLTPHVGIRTKLSELPAQALADYFIAELEKTDFYQQMPWDSRRALAATGSLRLKRFIAAQPEATILELESSLNARLDVDDCNITVTGTLDRVDRRLEGVVVLDYKTGTVMPPSDKLWADEDLWDRVGFWEPGQEDPREEFAKRLSSVQLPLYCWLYRAAKGRTVTQAAWVELKDAGAEKGLFGKKTEEEERERAGTELAENAMRFLVRHMVSCQAFTASPSIRCRFCPHRRGCPSAQG